MDTREKIVPSESTGSLFWGGNWFVVVGLFDPLTAAQARRLAEFARNGRNLLAVVLTGNNTLLTAEARGALVASLREIHRVLISEDGQWRSRLPVHANIEILEDAKGEEARSAEFVRFILERQKSGGG